MILCIAAVAVALTTPVGIPSWVYPMGVAAATLVSTWMLFASYYRTDRLADYLQLPVRSSRFLIALVGVVWLLLLLEVLAPVAAFGLASHTLGWTGLVACVASQGAVIASLVAGRTLVGRCGWGKGSVAVVVTVGLGGGLVALSRQWGPLVWALLVGALALAWLATDPPYHPIGPTPSVGTARSGNYFLSVLTANPLILLNGAMLVAFAALFTVMTLHERMIFPAAFAIVSVSSPIATMLSTDKDTTTMFRMLGRPKILIRQYTACVFIYFAAVDLITLLIFRLAGWPNPTRLIGLAVAATAVETILVPLLEARFPLRRWKTVRDVWRHPRKYLVPTLILIMTTLFTSI